MDPDFSEKLISLLPNLRRFAKSLVHAPDIADDLVQITVERAIAHWKSFDGSARLEPWLFRIMRNARIDMVRRDRIAGSGVDVHAFPEILPHDPRSGIEARITLRSVQAAVRELPPDLGAVLHLVCVEELTYAEAADVLEIPIGTVMSRLSRARLALARKLGIEDRAARIP